MKGNKQIELKAQRYLYERAHLSGSCVVTTFDPFDLKQAFIDGAEWQYEQFEKERLKLSASPIVVIGDVESLIESLEVKEVDLDFEQELYKAFGQVKDFTLGMRIAKHFYELGIKTKKGE